MLTHVSYACSWYQRKLYSTLCMLSAINHADKSGGFHTPSAFYKCLHFLFMSHSIITPLSALFNSLVGCSLWCYITQVLLNSVVEWCLQLETMVMPKLLVVLILALIAISMLQTMVGLLSESIILYTHTHTKHTFLNLS